MEVNLNRLLLLWVVLVLSGRSCLKTDGHFGVFFTFKRRIFQGNVHCLTISGCRQLHLTLSVTQQCCGQIEYHGALVTVTPAALEAGPCPSPPPKSDCLLAALSSARVMLRVLARTSSSCPRSAWTESSSVWRAWIFPELRERRKCFQRKG